MICDPHHVPYGKINLDKEMWREIRNNSQALELSNKIKAITENNQVAVITKKVLQELSFESTINTEIPSCLIPYNSSFHWSAVALCMMSHCSMEYFNRLDYEVRTGSETDIENVRFFKSLFDNVPYYDDFIVSVPDPTCRWGKYVLKDSITKELIVRTVVIEPEISQLNLFG